MKSKRMKPVKAWAIVDRREKVCDTSQRRADLMNGMLDGDRIVRVLITEVSRRVKR